MKRAVLLILAALVFTADRLTKLWVQHHIAVGRARVVIPRVFRITHVLNTGAAFSLFAGDARQNAVRIALIAFSSVAVVLMFVLILRYGRAITPNTVAFALILGGAAGNLFDRIRIGEVIDFVEVHIGSYHYPDFNVADSCIVLGGILIFVASLRGDKQQRP